MEVENSAVVATTPEPQPDAQVETTPGGETTETAAVAPGASTTQIDWDSDDNPWKGKATKGEERLKVAQGNARKQAEQEALILSLGDQLKAIREHLTSDAYADPASLKAKFSEVDSKAKEAVLASRDVTIATRWYGDIVADLVAAGISPDDERVTPAKALWDEGGTHETPTDMAKLYEARELVRDLKTATLLAAKDKEVAEAKKQAQDAETRFKIDGGLLEGANPKGTPSGSLDARAYAEKLRKGEAIPDAQAIDRLTSKYLVGTP